MKVRSLLALEKNKINQKERLQNMAEIIVMTEERLREIIKDVLPNGEKLSPEDRYVTTEQLSKIMKVSPQMINTYKGMGMFGYCGENLWDWPEAIRWRRDVYSQVTSSNRKTRTKKA
jgi:hypothetical protein